MIGRHRDGIRTLVFSPDGQYVLSTSMDRTAKVGSTKTGTEHLTLLGHTNRVNGGVFSPDGDLIATTGDDGTVRVWETDSGMPLMVARPGGGVGRSIAFSPDGRYLAVAHGAISLYRLADRRARRRLAGHTYHVHGVTFPGGGPALATCSADKSIVVWDAATGRPVSNFRGHPNKSVTGLKSSPDGKWLAAANKSFFNFVSHDHVVRAFEMPTGSVRQEFTGQETDVMAVAFDPESRLLAACGADGKVLIWDLECGQEVHRWTASQTRGALQVEFVAQGTQLLFVNASELSLYRRTDGEFLRTRAIPGGILSVALLAGGEELFVGGGDGALRRVTLRDLEIRVAIENTRDGSISAVAVSDDGRWLASCGKSRKIALWNLETGEKELEFPSQYATVSKVAFDATGTFLAAAGTEEQVTLWNLRALRAGLASLGLDWTGEFTTVADRQSAEHDGNGRPGT
jgi:WD40 repeat protein